MEIGINLPAVVLGNGFLDRTKNPNQKTKKRDKLNIIKRIPLRKCASKDTIKKNQRSTGVMGKKFYKSYTCKELITRIYKELLQLNNKITSNPI